MIISLYAGGMTIRDLQHHLGSLKWIPAAENVCLIGPSGTGKSHMLLALGEAAMQSGHRIRSRVGSSCSHRRHELPTWISGA